MSDVWESQLAVANGVEGRAFLWRHDGRWKMNLFTAPWLEDDLRSELKQGFALIVDPKSTRTNGIDFIQIERGD